MTLPAPEGVPCRLAMSNDEQIRPHRVQSIPVLSEQRPSGSESPMAILRLFAGAREEAQTSQDDFDGVTVGELLDQASERYGPDFATVLACSRVWLNGEATSREATLEARDEVAVLPPVSGGA